MNRGESQGGGSPALLVVSGPWDTGVSGVGLFAPLSVSAGALATGVTLHGS